MAMSNRLPTLREVDCLQESNMTTSSSNELQKQLQQQQQQYAMLLAQATQQQQLPSQLAMFSNFNSHTPMSPSCLGSPQMFPSLQGNVGNHLAISSPPTPRYASPNSSYTCLSQAANPNSGSPTQSQNQLSGFHVNTVSPSGAMFILPLAEGNEKNGSNDSGLGSGHLGTAISQGTIEVMRKLQLIGEDGCVGGSSMASLQSSDSDRQRLDSSQESVTNSGRPLLPTLHQQLENIRIGSDGEERSSGGTLRRNGPFITRSTSEKVPHRNEILAQVQRTAWARHTTK